MTPKSPETSTPVRIPIIYSGAYLYQAPHHLQVPVDKDLAVVFCLKNIPSTGLVFHESTLSTKELLSELSLLFQKIKSKLNLQSKDIHLKVFGLSNGSLHLLSLVKEWANSVGLTISVTEFGKGVVRNLSIDCASGTVSVKFGELDMPNSKPLFLAEGTARERIPLAKVHNKILILTKNAVQRQLTKAAIEEYPAWAAETIDEPDVFIKSSSVKKNQWSVVLCFQDMNEEKGLKKFLNELKEHHPSTEIRWVGSQLPDFLNHSDTKILPPIDYALLPDFKKLLKRAVFDANLAMNFESVKISRSKAK